MDEGLVIFEWAGLQRSMPGNNSIFVAETSTNPTTAGVHVDHAQSQAQMSSAGVTRRELRSDLEYSVFFEWYLVHGFGCELVYNLNGARPDITDDAPRASVVSDRAAAPGRGCH